MTTKKLSTTITPKPAAKKSTSRKAIPMMIMVMAMSLVGTFASMVTPAQATLSRDLPITIPEPPNGGDDGRLAGSVLQCLAEHPQFPAPDFGIFDCLRALR